MLSKIPAKQIFLGDYGWHVGRFHFSFADYVDPGNLGFGDLLTFNDFTLQPCSGFDTHPHREVEIISYCLEGELVHEDNLGNKEVMQRGDMQYTCAGSGITHSERNGSQDSSLRFIQVWIKPNTTGLLPRYHSVHYERPRRLNKFLRIASGRSFGEETRINQDTDVFVAEMEAGRRLAKIQPPNRQVYLACLEGSLDINGVVLNAGDALKGWDESQLAFKAIEDCHLIGIDVSRVL